MDATFINSKIIKTSDFYRLLLSLTDKIDLRRKEKTNILHYEILAFTV